MSPQRRYQLRHRALGLCQECPRPALDGWRCAEHQEENRARQRSYARRRRRASRLKALRRRRGTRKRKV